MAKATFTSKPVENSFKKAIQVRHQTNYKKYTRSIGCKLLKTQAG